MTVATSVSSLRRPRSFIDTARIAMIWSPSTTLPAASTARQRSASPSWAMPTSAPTRDDVLGERVEVRRADAVVDVEAVGVGADDGDAGAGIPERLGRDSGCRAMRAVQHDVDAVQPVRQRREQVQDVAVLGVGEARDAPDVAAGGLQLRARHGGLDALLDDVGQLDAAAREDLDAVVGRRVVRRRDHDAEVGVDVGDEERRGRGRQNARVEHVDAGGGEACLDGGAEEVTRDARVAGDDRGEAASGGPAGLGGTALAQDDGGRLGQGQCEIGGEGAVGQPPHPVRAKKRHTERSADQRFEY